MSAKYEKISIGGETFYVSPQNVRHIEKAIKLMGVPRENISGQLAEVIVGDESFFVMPEKAKNAGRYMPSEKIIGELIRIFGGSRDPQKVRVGSMTDIVPRRNINLEAATNKFIEKNAGINNKSKCVRILQSYNFFQMDLSVISRTKAETIAERINEKDFCSEDFLVI